MPYTKQTREQALADVAAGYSVLSVAKSLGCSKQTVYNWLRQPAKRLPPDPAALFEATQAYLRGERFGACCKRFGLSRGAFGYWLRQQDVPRNNVRVGPRNQTRDAAIRILWQEGKSALQLAKQFGLSRSRVRQIALREKEL